MGPRLEYILYAALAALIEQVRQREPLGSPADAIGPSVPVLGREAGTGPHGLTMVLGSTNSKTTTSGFCLKRCPRCRTRSGSLMAPQLRNILGQVTRAIDARFMMDRKRIFIANLAKGKLGEDKSNLLGALLSRSFTWRPWGGGCSGERAADFRLLSMSSSRCDGLLRFDSLPKPGSIASRSRCPISTRINCRRR